MDHPVNTSGSSSLSESSGTSTKTSPAQSLFSSMSLIPSTSRFFSLRTPTNLSKSKQLR